MTVFFTIGHSRKHNIVSVLILIITSIGVLWYIHTWVVIERDQVFNSVINDSCTYMYHDNFIMGVCLTRINITTVQLSEKSISSLFCCSCTDWNLIFFFCTQQLIHVGYIVAVIFFLLICYDLASLVQGRGDNKWKHLQICGSMMW